MERRIRQKIIAGLLVLAAISMMAPAAALAVGTTAGTAVTNTPQVQYSVGGVAQPLYTAPTMSFVVDTKVIFTVAKTDAAPVNVSPGSSNRALNFQLANASNAQITFLLSAANLASGATVTFGGVPYTDSNIDTTNNPPRAFFDANGNGSYEAGEEYVTIAAGVTAPTVTVLIHGNIPNAASGQTIGVVLTAQAVVDAVSGTPLVESAADTAGVDIVLADGAGTDDGARGGTFTDRSAYRIAAAILSVTKTATTIWDPYNYAAGGATAPGNPKAIPGALIQYQITIRNDALATDSATLTTVADTLSANLRMDPDLKVAADNGPLSGLSSESAAGSGFKATWTGTGPARASFATPKYYTTTSSADGIDHDGAANGGTITATMASVLPPEGTYTAGELKPGDAVTITFNAEVM